MITEDQKEKLWKWAGFKVIAAKNHRVYVDGVTLFENPITHEQTVVLPDLTWENIEKYFVPKLGNYAVGIIKFVDKEFIVILCDRKKYYGVADTLPEGFLAALLKLMEDET